VNCILKELFGAGVEKLKVDHRTFSYGSSGSVEISLVVSNHHIELNPSDAGFHDRIVVQELIKEIAMSHPLDATINRSFKVVVLNDVDRLSKEAQHSLRRTMEKYVSTCRLILCCNSSSRVLEPIRSRCLCIRVPAPSTEDIVTVLQGISKKEGFVLPVKLAQRIADQSEKNLRKSILMLESTKVSNATLDDNTPLQQGDWERFIAEIAKEILEEQSPKRLLLIRGKMYDLLTHCIPAELIIKKLTLELLKKLDADLKYEVIKWAAFYEHRLQIGSKAIFHIEAFIAKFMSIYKNFLVTAFGY